MWGITGRGARANGTRKSIRSMQAGLARIAVRGPIEHGVLEISGELDFSDADAVFEIASGVPHRIVSVDLAGLDFVDAAGARTIDAIRDACAERTGERPAIIGANRAVERTLRLVRTRTQALLMS